MTENEQIIRNNLAQCSTNICEKLGIDKKEMTLDKFPVELSKVEFEPHSQEHLTYEQAYEKYRLKSWFKMPEPKLNEVYALFQFPDSGSALLSIKITTKEGGITNTLMIGADENGNYDGSATKTVLIQDGNNEIEVVNIKGSTNSQTGNGSGTVVEGDFTSGWGPLTENGMAQCYVKFGIRGSKQSTITGIEIQPASKKPTPEGFKCWNIVELVGNCPELEVLKLGNFVGNGNQAYRSLSKLKFVKFYGSTKLKDLTRAFNGCSSLIAVDIPCDQTEGITSLRETFSGCQSLVSVNLGIKENNPSINMERAFSDCHCLNYINFNSIIKPNNLMQAFIYCNSLSHLPELDTSEVKDVSYFASNCCSIQEIPFYDFSSVINLASAFYECISLLTVPRLNIEKVENMENTFKGCYSLITMPEIYAPKCTSMRYCFSECSSLNYVGDITVAESVNTMQMFANCFSLTKIKSFKNSIGRDTDMFKGCASLISLPELKFSGFSYTYMFRNCTALSSLQNLEIKNVPVNTSSTSKTLKFPGCYCLAKLTFAPTCDPFDFNLDFSECAFGQRGLVALFNSLPNSTKNNNLIISNNRGASVITDEEKKIATDKGWNVIT